MSKDYYDILQLGVGQICHSHEAMMEAAGKCQQALAAFSTATQGSAQHEVNEARQGYGMAATQLQQMGSLLIQTASALQAYAASINPHAEEVPLPAATQAYLDREAAYASASPSNDTLHSATMLTASEYQQFHTSLQTNANNDLLRLNIPGGYVTVKIEPSPHGQEANIDYVRVNDGQQQGKGSYLIAAAAREASLRGVESMSGYYVSPYSLKALARAVGEKHIQIQTLPDDTYFPVKSYAAAIEALDIQEATPNRRTEQGVRARVDLRNRSVQSRLFGR